MQALAKLCVRRPVFATMLVLSLVVVGAFSYFTLGVDLLPKVDLPVVTIIVSDPGASPEEIETEISKKIEDAVNTISDIDELRSTSTEGQSLVMVTFELSKDGNVGAEEVQNKVNQIVNQLPQSAKTPVVQKLDTDAAPVIQLAVSSPRSLRDLTLIADKLIRQKLQTATGVGQVLLVGGARREIHVNVDPEKLRAYGLTITDVVNAVRQQNLEIPGGALNAGTKEFTVRTMGRITDPKQFNDIAIGTQQGYVVKVSDIGGAEDSYEEPSTTSRLNGTPAITLVISKQSGANTVETATDIKDRLKDILPTLPKGRSHADHCGPVDIHSSGDRQHQGPPGDGQSLRMCGDLSIPCELADHAYSGGCYSHLDHLHLCTDEGAELHLESADHAGPHADGRYRNR